MDRSGILFAWARYYAPLVALCLVAGSVGGAAYVARPQDFVSATSTVVETGDRIPPLQLDSIARVLFRSARVYEPAMKKLGVAEAPEAFLESRTELEPVADTTVLRVIGRAGNQREADEISLAMAESLIAALKEQRQRPLIVPPSTRPQPEFILFSGPEPDATATRVATGVALGLGGLLGLWFGVAVALIHYAWRRPLLTLGQALEASGARSIGVIYGHPSAWLGVFRPRLRWRMTQRNRVWLARLGELFQDATVDVEPVGVSPKKRDWVTRRFLRDLETSHPNVSQPPREPRMNVIVAHAGAPYHEVELAMSMLMGGRAASESRQLGLVWVN